MRKRSALKKVEGRQVIDTHLAVEREVALLIETREHLLLNPSDIDGGTRALKVEAITLWLEQLAAMRERGE